MRFFVALLLRMTPIYAVSGWALIIAISAQLSASIEQLKKLFNPMPLAY
jgi:hypothetical protein